MKRLSTNEAAGILGVSGATVRNWFRAGYLQAVSERPLAFTREEVLSLQERIRTNRFNRLRKRANKSASEKRASDTEVVEELARIIKLAGELDMDAAVVLFVSALFYLETEDEVAFSAVTFEPAALTWRRPVVGDIMREWRKRVPGDIPSRDRSCYNGFFHGTGRMDFLGVLYQGLSSVGKRSTNGAYFTPWKVIDESLDNLGAGDAPASMLDPCCGTGRYLVRAAARFQIPPENLHGFDSDPIAVDIARLNILLHFRDCERMPDVRCLDSLNDLANGLPDCDTNHLLGKVDAIATNPPWGGCKNLTRNKNLAEMVRTGETFSLFLEKSLHLLRDGGVLSFILPESMLQIKAHAEIRGLLLRRAKIRRITLLGRVFADVFTDIIRLDLEKRAAEADHKVEVVKRDRTHHCRQSRFAENAGNMFDVAVTPRDEDLLGKIMGRKHHTLRQHADWALGIVTGDNARSILDAPGHETEPILRGRDVFKYAPRPPRSHIRFEPGRFQQVAPEHLYRAPEKLVYRFVSTRLVFAYDDQGLLTLNSANILIPRIPDLPMKAALAFLNSRVFQYIFSKRFRTRKILRSDLERMPFPVLSKAAARAVEEQVDLCMGGDYGPADELDRLVYRAFGLNDRDVEVLETGLREETGADFY